MEWWIMKLWALFIGKLLGGFESQVTIDYSGPLEALSDPRYNINLEDGRMKEKDTKAKMRYAVYWGQNSYGASHPNSPDSWEKPMKEYCRDDTVDIIILSFLNIFNSGTDKPPELNLSYHCNTTFDAHPMLLRCPEIGRDIMECQQRGKKVLLSLGGAAGSYGFTKVEHASSFAKTIWNMFLGGKSSIRPFGLAILDGVDLDIEGGSPLGYAELVHSLREMYVAWPNKRFYVAAAPQCVFPDAFVGAALNQAWFDFVFVQFYNNYCGVQAFNNPYGFNFHQWDDWAKSSSLNPRVKVFLGVPGSATAANSGYLEPTALMPILKNVSRTFPAFGGVMAWDVSQAENNHFIDLDSPFSSLISTWIKNPNVKSLPNEIPLPNPPAVERRVGTEGYPCHGASLNCLGNAIVMCSQGVWAVRPCPPQHTCSSTYDFPVCHHNYDDRAEVASPYAEIELMPVKRLTKTTTQAQLRIWSTSSQPIPSTWSFTVKTNSLKILAIDNARIEINDGSTIVHSLPNSPTYMSLRLSILVRSIRQNSTDRSILPLLPRLEDISLNF